MDEVLDPTSKQDDVVTGVEEVEREVRQKTYKLLSGT